MGNPVIDGDHVAGRVLGVTAVSGGETATIAAMTLSSRLASDGRWRLLFESTGSTWEGAPQPSGVGRVGDVAGERGDHTARLYDEFLAKPGATGPVPSCFAFFDPAVEIHQSESFLGTQGTFHGYDGLRG